MSQDRVTAAIASAADQLYDSTASLEKTLQQIALAARDTVPGFDLAGVATVDARGTIETRAVTDPQVRTLDELQYSLDEGPGLDALGTAEVIAVPRIQHEQRWPRYVAEAVRLGLRSQLAVRMAIDDEGTLGGVNLYSTVRDDIEPEAVAIAELFAIHAASVLGSAVHIDQLQQAIDSRTVIGQAIGILMERYELAQDQAFQFLVRASQSGNVKVREVAQRLVDEGNERASRRREE